MVNTVLDLSSMDTFILDFTMDVLTDGDFLSVLIDTLKIILPRLGLVKPGFVPLMVTLTAWVITIVVIGIDNFSSVPNDGTAEEEEKKKKNEKDEKSKFHRLSPNGRKARRPNSNSQLHRAFRRKCEKVG